MVRSSDTAYNCGPSLLDDLDDLDTALRAKRRWRMAFLALRVVRVMLELPKEIVSRAKKYGDVEIDHNSFVSDVDDHEGAGLAETVKEKNLAAAKSRDSPYGYGKLLVDITTTLTRAKMRWRMAYATIYAVRAMLSLPKELLNKKNNYKKDSEILHSYSYTALDAKPSTSHQEIITETDRCSFLPNTVFDHVGLVRVVKDKDLGALNQFGGVIGVSTYLKTNPQAASKRVVLFCAGRFERYNNSDSLCLCGAFSRIWNQRAWGEGRLVRGRKHLCCCIHCHCCLSSQ